MHKAKAKSAHQRAENEAVQEQLKDFEQETAAETTAGTGSEAAGEVQGEADSELESELQLLKEELSAAQERNLRLAAEYDNFRKRSRQEKEDLYVKSLVDVTALWLPLIDNLERAVNAMEGIEHEASRQAADGVRLVLRQAEEIMTRLEVSEIEALGASFNPELHEAVMHIEDEEKAAAEIVEVFQKGYRRGDKVLRHSVVKVAN